MLALLESFSRKLLLKTINIQQLQLTCIQNITADLGGVSLALIVGLTVNKVFAGFIVGQGLCSKFYLECKKVNRIPLDRSAGNFP